MLALEESKEAASLSELQLQRCAACTEGVEKDIEGSRIPGARPPPRVWEVEVEEERGRWGCALRIYSRQHIHHGGFSWTRNAWPGIYICFYPPLPGWLLPPPAARDSLDERATRTTRSSLSFFIRSWNLTLSETHPAFPDKPALFQWLSRTAATTLNRHCTGCSTPVLE